MQKAEYSEKKACESSPNIIFAAVNLNPIALEEVNSIVNLDLKILLKR